ncbi:MAG: glycosyltransferase family 2 protein [Clostridia bacterium]|nr:glycosyltransferase family 2 protein [Clostridia bacterium]
MEQTLVTVVVPVYNVEKYLDRCVQSIVDQTYQNLQIILVDDGSPDNCPQMCDDWARKDARIEVIHKQNAGLGMARNSGIECAKGEYICFFDSDDYIAKETIEHALTLALQEAADIVAFGIRNVDAVGCVIKTIIPDSPKRCWRGDEVQAVFLPDLIDSRTCDVQVKGLTFAAWSNLFSMDLVRKTNWRFVSERQNISEDSYSLLWLYRHVNSVAVLPEDLYFYCENQASLTKTYRPDRYERICNFYYDTTAMAKQMYNSDAILQRIAGLFFGFSVAAMKQIMAADMSRREKRRMIAAVITKEPMCSVLRQLRGSYPDIKRRVLMWAMDKKLCGAVCLLLQLQNKTK